MNPMLTSGAHILKIGTIMWIPLQVPDVPLQTQVPVKDTGMMVPCLCPCCPCRRPRWNPWLLALASPILGVLANLGNPSGDERTSLSSYHPSSLLLSFLPSPSSSRTVSLSYKWINKFLSKKLIAYKRQDWESTQISLIRNTSFGWVLAGTHTQVIDTAFSLCPKGLLMTHVSRDRKVTLSLS